MTGSAVSAERSRGLEPMEYVPGLSFHGRPSHPCGSGALTLTVGGISVHLAGFSPSQESALRARFGVFCAAAVPSFRPSRNATDAGDATGAADMTVDVSVADREAFLVVRPWATEGPGVEYYRIDTRWEGEALLATSYEWAGWFDRTTRKGGLALASSALDDPVSFDRSLENFLRVVFAHLAVGKGSFILHSAGLVKEGRAYLFFGPSGAGKTTVTSMTPEALVLSDDLTLVTRGPDGSYHACSVPFRGVFAPEPVSSASYPIAGFFRLVQDRSDYVVPLRGAMAIGELVGSLPFVTQRPEMAGDVIDVVAAAAAEVPVFKLHFRKDRTFWDIVGRVRPSWPSGALVDDFSPVRGI